MNLVVTGATGFLGKNFLEYLSQADFSARVFGLGRDEATLELCRDLFDGFVPIQADLTDKDLDTKLAKAVGPSGLDRIVHLAAYDTSPKNDAAAWQQLLTTNVLGTINLWQSIKGLLAGKTNAVFVNASSIMVYGNAGDQPARETAPAEPIDYYGISKLGGEYYSNYYARILNVPVVNLRIGFVYGPGDTKKVTHKFLLRAIKGEELVIFGHPEAFRDYVYVDDVSEIMRRLLVSPPSNSRTLNCSPGQGVSLMGLARIIQRKTGSRSPIRVRKPAASMGFPFYGCVINSQEAIGELFDQFTGIEEGIHRSMRELSNEQ